MFYHERGAWLDIFVAKKFIRSVISKLIIAVFVFIQFTAHTSLKMIGIFLAQRFI